MAEELLTKNVAAAVKLPTSRSRRRKAWSGEEARRFLESARSDGDPFYAAYVLVLVLGLRKGEVLGLTWQDIDLDDAELTVGLQLQTGPASTAASPDQDGGLGQHPAPAVDLCDRAGPPPDPAARRPRDGRAGLAGLPTGVHYSIRHADRTS